MQNVSVLVDLHRGVEGAPEDDAADEAADRQEAEAEMHARPADDRPVAPAGVAIMAASPCYFLSARRRRLAFATASTSSEAVAHQRLDGSCATWHCLQK